MIQAQKDLLKELGKSNFGHVLSEYLKEEKENIKDITQTKSWEETLGRQHAIRVIDKLFSFMEDKNSPEKSKNQYL